MRKFKTDIGKSHGFNNNFALIWGNKPRTILDFIQVLRRVKTQVKHFKAQIQKLRLQNFVPKC